MTQEEIIKIQLKTDIDELKKDAEVGMRQEDLDKELNRIWKKAWRFGFEDIVFTEIFGK